MGELERAELINKCIDLIMNENDLRIVRSRLMAFAYGVCFDKDYTFCEVYETIERIIREVNTNYNKLQRYNRMKERKKTSNDKQNVERKSSIYNR